MCHTAYVHMQRQAQTRSSRARQGGSKQAPYTSLLRKSLGECLESRPVAAEHFVCAGLLTAEEEDGQCKQAFNPFKPLTLQNPKPPCNERTA